MNKTGMVVPRILHPLMQTICGGQNNRVTRAGSHLVKDSVIHIGEIASFIGQRFFKVETTAQNLFKAIENIDDGMSTNPSDYRVTMARILFEFPNYVASG